MVVALLTLHASVLFENRQIGSGTEKAVLGRRAGQALYSRNFVRRSKTHVWRELRGVRCLA